jgi:hypothetical protein
MLIIILFSMSCLFYRQEREHILFQRGPLLQIWAVGVERGIYGAYWLCVSSFILVILGRNCVKANSCEKFEAKISEKSEKKGSEYLKRTSESHVKRISVRLLFALKRKKFLSETGAPYSRQQRSLGGGGGGYQGEEMKLGGGGQGGKTHVLYLKYLLSEKKFTGPLHLNLSTFLFE